MMKRLFFTLILTASCILAAAYEHPCLLLTKDSVKQIRKTRTGKAPMFDVSMKELLGEADLAVARELSLPAPKDGGGGYTHEAHKQNYYDMYHCGIAWQVTGESKYAAKVREMLLSYAKMYPTLGYHPITRSSVRGRLFWQTLNESVWLMHTSIAYDCVKDYLKPEERREVEDNLLRKVADFIMEGTADNRANLKTFNSMTNHGTWALAAVGMAALAMDDEDLVSKSLYGSDGSGKNGGFLMQIREMFSPDGYFTEGAYYQRYAIWPFVTYAQCIDHVKPELDIFHYRNGTILKAVDTILQMAYDGEFMHFNDALEKGYTAQEIMYAVDIAYNADRSDRSLLSIARDYQGKVLVSDAGYAVARDIAAGKAEPFRFRSTLLRDGSNGTDGALAIFRSGREDMNSALTMKATSQGLGHGHYDKLTIAYYDEGNEIITDYGAARFLNVEAKSIGNYTKQNKSYAMTTIAHNTLTVDCKSDFNGDFREASLHSPRILAFSADNRALQYVAAVDSCAYPGVRMERWLAWADLPFLQYPLVIDILKAGSADAHTYDYPIHYNGHMISTTVPYTKAGSSMKALGKGNGYQHLWVEAEGKGGDGCTSYTWMTGHRMYSITTATTAGTEVKWLRTGANDPEFNLRSEPAWLIRENNAKDHVFASCIESHGTYDLVVEQSANLVHSCTGVKVLESDGAKTEVEYTFIDGHSATVTIENGKLTIKSK